MKHYLFIKKNRYKRTICKYVGGGWGVLFTPPRGEGSPAADCWIYF